MQGGYDFLHKYLAVSQHGFRRGRSCLTNLLCFLDKVTSCLDDKDCMDIVFLDLAKAFDKVPQEINGKDSQAWYWRQIV